MKPATLILPGIAAMTLTIRQSPAADASSAGFGHADFQPSPERPIGFRADGNAWGRPELKP